jgi:hypothetical protein
MILIFPLVVLPVKTLGSTLFTELTFAVGIMISVFPKTSTVGTRTRNFLREFLRTESLVFGVDGEEDIPFVIFCVTTEVNHVILLVIVLIWTFCLPSPLVGIIGAATILTNEQRVSTTRFYRSSLMTNPWLTNTAFSWLNIAPVVVAGIATIVKTVV